MITLRASPHLKDWFFDREKVIKAMGRARAQALNHAGASVRLIARQSLRRRKKISSPGQPPSVHATDKVATLKNILYAATPDKSVVVGPVGLDMASVTGSKPTSGTVPEVLEFGGKIGIIEVFKYNRWWRADLRSKRRNSGLPQRVRTVQIAARPFMGPALKASPIAQAFRGGLARSA
jgi:hypothetical protein